EWEIFQRLGVALAIGLLVGIERGWRSRDNEPGTRRAGLRTFTLLGLLGGLIGHLSFLAGDIVIAAGILGAAILIALGYWAGVRRQQGDLGLTSEVAAMLTFALGVLAVRGDMVLAVIAGVIMVAFLGVKEKSHQWLARLEQVELVAGIKLLLVSVVLLPLLPDRRFGPGEVLNPYEIWWMVVLISGISYAGYFALKIGGEQRGALWMGVFGGIASSTALTLSCARLAARTPRLARQMAASIALASAVMFVRSFLIAWLLMPALAFHILVILLPASLAALAITYYFSGGRHLAASDPQITLPPPGELMPAIYFGLLLAGVILLSHYMQNMFGTGGLLALAATTGLVDVDAVTISMSRLSDADPEGIILGPAG
ncbi:MAG TPA: hypothetical protein DDW95_01700, partial [Alphaproteobacteria bacterium]|nr:hypothetical protein [Alphaproteobacteria bacterium]